MQNNEQQQAFEKEMQAIIAGKQAAPNKTLQHFAERFRQTQQSHDELAKSISDMEQKAATGKLELAKLLGFLEHLAQDLRHLWDEAQTSPASSEKPDIAPAS